MKTTYLRGLEAYNTSTHNHMHPNTCIHLQKVIHKHTLASKHMHPFAKSNTQTHTFSVKLKDNIDADVLTSPFMHAHPAYSYF